MANPFEPFTGRWHQGIAVAAARLPRWTVVFRRFNTLLDRLALRWSRPYFLRFDAFALWFYTVCLAAFVILSVLCFHGSSIETYGENYGFSDHRDPILIGQYRGTRVDEWNFHTPAILNQLFKADPLALTGAEEGPGKAALMANVPANDYFELFRPQFWAFHVLPAEMAYSFYWQTKALLLLTGVFTLLLLLTGGASRLAAFGSLWFYFSSYTQWTYSWPSLLPEMIGLFGWVMCLGFYLLVGRSPWRLALAALACAAGMVDFALCAYPPQQIPLITIGAFLTVWWLWGRWDSIFTREGILLRLLALCGCLGLVGVTMISFAVDARAVLLAAAHTVYPGQRVCAGGGVTAEAYADHFLDFWKSETHFPPILGNPSEGTGYLWLAPLTLLGRGWGALPREKRIALGCCWAAFAFIGAWMSLPIPAWVGHWFFYDRVLSNRCYHALGLANVAIVVLALSRPPTTARPSFGESACRFVGFALIAFTTLSSINSEIANFYSVWMIVSAALYAGLLAVCTTEHWKKALAVSLLLPSILVTGQINPLQRHLHVVTKSALYKFAHRQPECLRGKWIIYADWVEHAGFFSAVGMKSLNSLKIIPQLAELKLFDPSGVYTDVINQSGYVVAKPLAENEPSVFESPSPGIVRWSVSPLDLRFRRIGVRYAAFEEKPGQALAAKLVPLSPVPISGLWLYRLP